MKAAWHPRLLRHAGFWMAWLSIFALIQLPGHWANGNPLYLWGLLFNQLPASVLMTYPLLYGLLPVLLRGRQQARFAAWGLAWLLLGLVTTTATRLFFDQLLAPALDGVAPRPVHWDTYIVNIYTYFCALITAGSAGLLKVMKDWQAQRLLGLALGQRKLKAELQLLKAQLQPAFLFDTLRTLHQLTLHKAPAAPGAVLHLADLLRYTLYESTEETVPLAHEVAMLRQYVALEQLRLGSTIEVSWSVSGALAEQRIAPLLLLPLVENAFRHAPTAGPEQAWISIDLVARKNGVVLKVLNGQAPGAEASFREGPGLHQVRRRLSQLYPAGHQLRVLSEPDVFCALLQLTMMGPIPAATPRFGSRTLAGATQPASH